MLCGERTSIARQIIPAPSFPPKHIPSPHANRHIGGPSVADILYKSIGAEQIVKKTGRTITACISSQAVDRDSDTVRTSGIDYQTYMKSNAILLWSHQFNMPSIGRCERIWLSPDKTKMFAELTFGSTDLAREIDSLYEQRMLNSFSIGFRIISAGAAGIYQAGKAVRQIDMCELLEISAVTVPSQSEAVQVILEQKGFSHTKESVHMAKKSTTATAKPTSTASGLEICPKCKKPCSSDVCKCNGGAQGNANGIAAADAVKRMQTAISSSLTEEQRLALAVQNKVKAAIEDGTVARNILEQVATQCEIFSAVKQLGDVLDQCREFAVKVDTERQLLEPGGKHGSTLAAKSQGYGVCPFRAGTSEAMIWAHEQKSLRRQSR
jgi:HK97 family phage prohead protease